MFLRVDFNVPLNDKGSVSDGTRIQAALPSIKYALEKNAAVMVCSHLGRPTEGKCEKKYSLSPIRDYLQNCLGRKIELINDWVEGRIDVDFGHLVLLENVRFAI